MRQPVLLAFTACLIASMSGCNPVYYVPNTHNVPMLQGRGDVSIAAQATSLGVEVQSAYAISDRIGLMVNAAGGRAVNEDENRLGSGDELFLEAGVGRYGRLSSRLVWGTYALLGVGHIKNDLEWTVREAPGTTGKIEADFVRYGIQPSLAWRCTYFDAIASLRLIGLRHSNVSGNLMFDQTDQVAYLESVGNQFLLEPALTVRVGRDPLKLAVQLGASRNLTHEEFHQVDNVVSLGIVYSPRRPR